MSRRRILIAEDNPGDVHLVQLALETHGVNAELQIVTRGDEVFGLLCKLGVDFPTPDLILMDLSLPGRNGIELLRTLRSSHPGVNVPVVVMTSSPSPAHRTEAEEIGISEFFAKPTDLDSFLKLGGVVRNILDGES